VIVSVSTRGLQLESIGDLVLVSSFLPGFVQTAEPGFVYWLYVGYDAGDAFMDKDTSLEDLTDWFITYVTDPLEGRGIQAELRFVRFLNALKKPGPMFNNMTRQAYLDGTTYLYRVNDDSLFVSQWARPLTNQLKAFGEPYGAVGPWCHTGNSDILTHDMTHRRHLDIFADYYPAQLTDWWLDDWITRVYGRSRTRRLRDVVIKHSETHGTRYKVNKSNAWVLPALLRKGHGRIAQYMEHRGFPADQIEQFRNDTVHFVVKNGR